MGNLGYVMKALLARRSRLYGYPPLVACGVEHPAHLGRIAAAEPHGAHCRSLSVCGSAGTGSLQPHQRAAKLRSS